MTKQMGGYYGGSSFDEDDAEGLLKLFKKVPQSQPDPTQRPGSLSSKKLTGRQLSAQIAIEVLNRPRNSADEDLGF